jgi:hypothetical protein
MMVFRTKWDDWNISAPPKCRTDKTDKSPSVSSVSAGLGHIQFEKREFKVDPTVCRQPADYEERAAVIAWINANPPDLPMHQNHCAACGEYIPVYDTGWVYLGDGALIHHGGERGRDCFDRWQDMRRDEAERAIGRDT